MNPPLRRTFARVLVLVVLILQIPRAQAQDAGLGIDNTDLSLHFGPLLPSRIPGVREILNGWGLRAGTQTARGFFEAEYFNVKGGGVTYQSVGLDARLKVFDDVLQAHALLGMHIDSFQGLDEVSKISGGWHIGGGVMQEIAGPFLLRGDFKYRFSPGTSLLVSIGVVYRFDSSSP